MRRFCSGLIKNHYIFKNFIAKGIHYTMRHEGVVDMVEMMDKIDFYLLVCVIHIVSKKIDAGHTV